MGAFLSQQPNGLLCRFSSITGTITDYNMTPRNYMLNRMLDEATSAALDLDKFNFIKPFHYITCADCQGMRPDEFCNVVSTMSKEIEFQPVQYYMDLPWTIITKHVQLGGESCLYGKILEIPECHTTANTLSDLYIRIYDMLKEHVQNCIEKKIPISIPIDIEDIQNL